MNIKVITLDKIRDKFAKEATAEYTKRLSKYCKLSYKECKSCTQVLKELDDKSFVVHISTQGNLISSEELAKKISDLALSGKSDISFLISQEELNEQIQEKINIALAVSKMDIDFSVLIVILHEQIYRAYRINSNEPYHK